MVNHSCKVWYGLGISSRVSSFEIIIFLYYGGLCECYYWHERLLLFWFLCGFWYSSCLTIICLYYYYCDAWVGAWIDNIDVLHDSLLLGCHAVAFFMTYWGLKIFELIYTIIDMIHYMILNLFMSMHPYSFFYINEIGTTEKLFLKEIRDFI